MSEEYDEEDFEDDEDEEETEEEEQSEEDDEFTEEEEEESDRNDDKIKGNKLEDKIIFNVNRSKERVLEIVKETLEIPEYAELKRDSDGSLSWDDQTFHSGIFFRTLVITSPIAYLFIMFFLPFIGINLWLTQIPIIMVSLTIGLLLGVFNGYSSCSSIPYIKIKKLGENETKILIKRYDDDGSRYLEEEKIKKLMEKLPR